VDSDATGTAVAAVPFAVAVNRCQDQVMLCLTGELDLCQVHILDQAVARVVAARPPARVVTADLAGLGFADVAGARAILAARQRLHAAGQEVRVLGVRDPVRRILALLRMDGF
jgi:anti-anti-sigma factor